MLHEPPPQINDFSWPWQRWLFGFWRKFNDLASTTTDDTDGGFHLVNYPPLTGEIGVTNLEYEHNDPKRWGVVSDGSTDDRAAWALADTGNLYGLRMRGGTSVIASNITISSDLIFDPGAIIKPSSGITVAFGGAIEAGHWKIFDFSAGGDVSVTDAASNLKIEWFDASDITTAFQKAATATPSTGSTLDASLLTGTQTLTGSIFNDLYKTIHLICGETTYEWDVSTINHNIYAGCVIEGHRTIFQPDAVGEAASGSTNEGLFTTMVTSTTGTMTAASRDITLASTTHANVGDVIAIDGAAGTDTNQQTTLTAGINSTDLTIPVTSTSGTASAGLLYVGTELIEYSSRDATNFYVSSTAQRGMYGTTAAAHSGSDTISVVFKLRGIIESISGSIVTLRGVDPASVIAVTSADVQIGQQGIRFEGDITFNGRQDRAGADAQPSLYGVKGRLASEMYVGPNVKFLDIDHAGVFLNSSYKCHITGRYKGNARPADLLGGDIWMFENSQENVIEPVSMEDGYTAIIIDDRTSTSGDWGGPSDNNSIILPPILDYSRAFAINGSSNNHLELPYATTTSDTIRIAEDQGSTPRVPTGNTINCGYIVSSGNYADIEGTGNVLRALKVSGTKTIDAGNVLDVTPTRKLVQVSAVNFASVATDTHVDVDVTVTGAATGDKVEWTADTSDAEFDGLFIRAWVTSANTVRFRATNTDTSTHNPVSTNFTITVIGGFETIP